MMNTDAVRTQLINTLVPAFASAHPTAVINYENQRLDQGADGDEGNGWIYVSVIPAGSKRKNLSRTNIQYCHNGIIQIQMGISKDKGTRKLHQFADTIINTMVDRDWNIEGGRLITFNADRRTRGVIGATYAMNVNISWEYTAQVIR